MVPSSMSSPQIPLATYRLQFNRDFTFADATQLVPYLAALGITHCYASPYLRARPGSTHGYDIIDHNLLNPEIGSTEDFEKFVATLRQHGMGHILDIVPNHMGVMGSDNGWWLDVLENGESSTYADFFDIDWQPLKDELQGKVLIPVLGDQYGSILDLGELKLTFDREKGEFSIFYHQHRFPVDPKEYPRVLAPGLEVLEKNLGASHADFLELQSLISAFNHLPGRQETAAEKRAERTRDKEIHKRRLAELCGRSSETCQFIGENVRKINGTPGDPSSFDALHELIKTQAYRLAYWRVAADDINYRRFFDINDLAGLRMENPAVFDATHHFILQLIRDGKVDGLRIDHPDGLYNPAQYFHRLQHQQDCPSLNQECDSKPVYVVIEKILASGEQLPADWPIYGTTGYDFANLVNGLFVDPESASKMDRVYRAFLGQRCDFDTILYQSKKIVMDSALASELNVLANILSRIALAERHTCDFTLNSLRDALSEIVANFPVYRTYITETHVSDTDRAYIEEAVQSAKRQSAIADVTVFDFIREVLLTQKGAGQTGSYRQSVVRFAMKFQQFTSAVMAKGLEDTSFYRYNRLASLNEVGGDPHKFGVSPDEFHREIQQRTKAWPHSLLDTSTHDTKRSEDVRARIDVLSEIPGLWRRNVRRWREMNADKKRMVDGSEAPSRNDEYLLYQTLIGTWPPQETTAGPQFYDRIDQYMLKAVREAKQRTSWANPNSEYEAAVAAFVKAILSSSAGVKSFLEDFVPFQRYVARLGRLNSLSQVLIKLTAPGVPDIYQGNELWDLSLVDPDNRRAVDYARRQRCLKELMAGADSCDRVKALVRELTDSLGSDDNDGRAKFYLTWKTLNLRKQHAILFQQGDYLPLAVLGAKANHLVAFARREESSAAIVAVPRMCARLLVNGATSPAQSGLWEDTRIELPPELSKSSYRNALTAELLRPEKAGESIFLRASSLLENFPVALLTVESRK
jgi:(1->4)-alpha-D-glucan 1-alpha-D-glucosylmutase